MGQCVRLVLPDVSNCAKTQDIIGRVVQRWNGVSIFTGRGLWRSDKGNVVGDRIIALEVSGPKLRESDIQWWTDLVSDARELLDQEAVYWSVREETAWLLTADNMEKIGG